MNDRVAASPESEKTASPEHRLPDVLRNNEEYMLLRRAIESLRSQLERAKSDMGILERLRDQALARPLEYIESLVAGEAPMAPAQQSVVDIPFVYVDSYLNHAEPAAIQSYMSYIQLQSRLNRGHLPLYNEGPVAKYVANGTRRSTSSRYASTGGYNTPTKASSVAKRGSRQPVSAGAGLLTGITAVATPEHSPRRWSNLSQSPSHAPALGLENMQRPSTVSLDHAARSGVSACLGPPIDRSNTEPVRRSSVSLSEPGSRSTNVDDRNGYSHKSVSKTSVTQPGTPTGRGGSQKTLTPQILEDFRRQVSEERSRPPSRQKRRTHSTGRLHDGINGIRHDNDEDGDDDEYYNRLVQSATAIRAGNVSSEDEDDADDDESDVPLITSVAQLSTPDSRGSYPAGKSLDFNSQYWQQIQSKHPSGNGSSRSAMTKSERNRSNNREFGAAATPKSYKSQKPGRRGPTRKYPTEPKPVNFNLPWTDEEQQQLEELLLVYPEEEVANDRWRKIGLALGTRTMRQVASRVQKYFIKLSKAGLPVPGRVPDTSGWTSIGARRDSGSAVQLKRKRKQPANGARSTSGSSSKRKKHVDFTSSSEEEEEEYGYGSDIDFGAFSDSNEHRQPMFGLGDTLIHDRKGKQADRSGVPDDDGVIDIPLGFGGGRASGIRKPQPFATHDGASASASTSANIQTPALRSAKA
ncbi:hypothetical protein EV175_001878, partial [Coemansia sp. RSA 1933]